MNWRVIDKMIIKEKILESLQEKKIFIGYYMLCRYLNDKGYKRYGCNAGYPEDDKSGNARLHPCKILCPDTQINPSKVRYYCKKLEKEGLLFLEKRIFYDSSNPNAITKGHLKDIFVFISLNEDIYLNYIYKNTLEKFLFK